MTQRPGFWGRLLARVEGEVPADTVEAYRRAGGPAYELHEQAEARRAEQKRAAIDPWAAPPAERAFMLCAWNAFVLQTLGDQFVEADYRTNPATVGYLPKVTAEQVLSFYRGVEDWLSRARRAESSPSYQIDVDLPTDLPPWAEVEPCPRAHMEGMLAAARLIAPHAETLVGMFEPVSDLPERQKAVRGVHEMLADARTRADYAERLYSPTIPNDLHQQVERSIKAALAQYFRAGQMIAMPSIAETGRVRAARGTATATSLPLPGEPGFDPWRLTDPDSRAMWQRDREARAAIDALWDLDPDPRRTLAIQAELEAALARGDIGYASGPSGTKLGSYYCCPWAPVYVAKRDVTLGGRRLRPAQEFTYDVSAEEVGEGGRFRREILPGTFSATDNVDYCNPRTGGRD